MHAVITGATGLLGSGIVTQLCQQGWSITAIVRSTSNRQPISLPGVQFHVCDLSRDELDPEVFRNADVVFHTAAAVTDWAPWPYFVANTVEATRRVCTAMTRAQCRRLVHISTVGVYGRPRRTAPITEDQPYSSIGRWDYYTNSKIQAEKIVWQQHREKTLEVAILRPAMLYGPGDHGLVQRVVPLLHQRKVVLVGDAWMSLPLVHVRDVAAAAVRAGTMKQAIGQAFNVVNSESVTQSDFFNTIAGLINAPSVKKCINYRLAYTAGFAAEINAHASHAKQAPMISRYRVSLFGHRRVYAIDKIRTTLDWQPQINFKDGIRQAIAR